MKASMKILIAICIFFLLSIAVMAISILQNGIGGWDGRSVEKILGVPPEKAALADIEKLSKSEVMQLFYAASAPEFARVRGEYKAKILELGITRPLASLYTKYILGPGDWKGKAFYPFGRTEGWGYNLWEIPKDGKPRIIRCVRMKTFIGKSRLDDKDSFQLDYSPFNGGIDYFMKDEARRINDRLYICMGMVLPTGHRWNPSAFVLYDPTPWIGPDKE
ncbi:MAG: hypothetical protein JW807_03800 [Spirochaetes bacterium]|nr:hypothetical protein [Spirochaetota bacterium]